MPEVASDPLLALIRDRGMLDDLQYEEVVQEVGRSAKPVLQVVQDYGLLDLDSALQIIADHLGTMVVALDESQLTPELLAAVPAESARMYQCVPIALYGDTLQLALADPLNPAVIDELARTVRQAVGAGGQMLDPAEDGPEPEGLPLVGRSAPMQAVYRMITRVLRNDLTVLILGESGTGKELVAEAIHQLGHRRGGPFIAVNTAAIPADLIESELFGHEKGAFTGAVARHIGKFEQATGGTLFLDEIGDMPMQAQTRLLRALQSGSIRRVGGREEVRIDTRIVAATNRDLEPLIAAGQFREDLFYRLNVVPIHMPALRERSGDIEALATHFLKLGAAQGLPRRQLPTDGAELLERQPWRGNVRELKNFIYRLALLAREDLVDAATIQPLLLQSQRNEADQAQQGADIGAAVARWIEVEAPPAGRVYDLALAAFERPLFTEVLRGTGGNQLRAAQILGINRNTLRKRLSELGLDPEGFVRKV